jgi:hypothetical protein
MTIPKEFNDEIWEYCRANGITNIDDFVIGVLKKGFTAEKFGSTPMVQKVVEKVVEVPVEKVIEKIIEVPINIIDKDLEERYNKIVSENSELQKKISSLEQELVDEKNKKKKDLYGES